MDENQSLSFHSNVPSPYGWHLLRRNQLRKMDAINWASGARPNRPFQNLSSRPIYKSGNIHNFIHGQPKRYNHAEPTDYFREQLFLARDGTGPDPYAHPPLAETRRRMIDHWIVLLTTVVIKPLLDFLGLVINVLLNSIFIAVVWGVVQPFKFLICLANKVEWDMMLGLVLAAQVATWLPSMGEIVLEELVNEVQAPIYIAYLPAGYAIGTGPNVGMPVQ